MVKPTRCAKCNGRMIEGHVIDGGYGASTASRWQPGRIERRWWGGIRVRDAELREVMAYRCEGCGYLESYVI